MHFKRLEKKIGAGNEKDEENFVRMQLVAAASLGAASAKLPGKATVITDARQIADSVIDSLPIERKPIDGVRCSDWIYCILHYSRLYC